MEDFKIFVEGAADQKFIHDLVRDQFRKSLDTKTQWVKVGGKDRLDHKRQQFQKLLDSHTEDSPSKALIIFDADDDRGRALENIREQTAAFRDIIEVFTFPDNAMPGDLEALLTAIAQPACHQPISGCFNEFKDCIDGLNLQNVKKHLPGNKQKLFVYTSIIYGMDDKRNKERERDYFDKKLWDIGHEATQPLRTFLQDHLSSFLRHNSNQ